MATQSAPASKKSAKAKRARNESTHPPYAQMIKEAITELKNKKGSSRAAILKYINENYDINQKVSGHPTNHYLNKALKHGIETGELKHSKGSGASGSFKLADKSAGSKKKTPVKQKKSIASKKIENTEPIGVPAKKSMKTLHANESPAFEKPTNQTEATAGGKKTGATKKGKAASAKK